MNPPYIIDAHTHIFNEIQHRDYKAKAKGRVSKAFVLYWFERDLNELLSFTELNDDLALFRGDIIY